MTVTAQTPYNTYTAAPGATVFSSAFRVIQSSDLVVKINGTTQTSGFTVSGLGAAGGVDVTFTTLMTGGEKVELLREIPLTRATDYQQLGDFLAPVVNLDFDRQWQAMQGIALRLGGALRMPYPEQAAELPAGSDRAGKLLSFDDLGNLRVSLPAVGSAEELADNLAADTGSSRVGYDDGTLQSIADGAKSMQSYTQLDGYQGRATAIKLTADGVDGLFVRDDSDTTTAASGVCRVDALGRRWKRRFDGDYLDSWWQPPINGADATDVYQAIALTIPDGAVLRCVKSGTRLIGEEVEFPQDHLKFICNPGVRFKQKNGTPAINTLITFSGDYCDFYGLDVDGNVAGNPTNTYTGRGELVKFKGNRATVKNSKIRDTQVKPFACGFYIVGKDCIVETVTGFDIGRVAIRDRGDRTTIRDVSCRDIKMSAIVAGDVPGLPIGNRVITKDGGSEEIGYGPFAWATYENIYGHSDGNGFYSTIVVDDSENIGGRVTVRDVFCDFPNATGPNTIKFVNVRRVDIHGLTSINGGSSRIDVVNQGSGYTSAPSVTLVSAIGDSGTGATAVATVVGGKVTKVTYTKLGSNYIAPPTVVFDNTGTGGTGASAVAYVGTNTCLRIQEGVEEVYLHSCELDGFINFDDNTTAVRTFIGGDCYIGRALTANAAIDDIPNGVLTIEDGAIIAGFSEQAVRTKSGFTEAKLQVGRVLLRPATSTLTPPGTLPYFCKYEQFILGAKPRIAAGQVRICQPVEMTGMSTLGSPWVLGADSLEASAMQLDDATHRVVSADFVEAGPRNVDGWRRGSRIYARSPSASQTPAYFECVTGGSSCQNPWETVTAWTTSFTYVAGQVRQNGGNYYICTVGGTSAASGGGPTGTGTSIVDGTCRWNYRASNYLLHDRVFSGSMVYVCVTPGNPGTTTPTVISDGTAAWVYVNSVNLQTAWSPATAYSVGDIRSNSGNNYRCVTAGISAVSGGPTGTVISDGVCVWDFVDNRAVFKPVGSIGF